jgi:Spy/CpxP family protein refolding chaperone
VTIGAPACASRAESEPVASAQGAVSEDPPEVAHLRFIRGALSKVSLRTEQKQQIDQLVADAALRHAPVQQARQALHDAVASQVQAGAIDRAALKPASDVLLVAIEQSRPADRAAVVLLHDLLDPAQRGQFVDAVEAQFREHQHGHPHMQHARKWAADLNLTDAQRQQIQAAVRAKMSGGEAKEQWRAAREQGKKVLESFRQDQFALDAATFALGSDKIERGMGKVLDLAEAALPVLTPEQRAIAAQKIRTAHGGW